MMATFLVFGEIVIWWRLLALLILLEYVRYGIEMKMETHKAIRSQHKNVDSTKIIKMMLV